MVTPHGLAALALEIQARANEQAGSIEWMLPPARQVIPSVAFAAATVGHHVTSTDRRAQDLQALVPVHLLTSRTTHWTADESPQSWKPFGRRAALVGVHSALVHHVHGHRAAKRPVWFSLFARGRTAFTGSFEAPLLAIAATIAELEPRATDQEPSDLLTALRDHRQIGTATGIVMATYDVDQEHAHALLRMCAQLTCTSLSETAAVTVARRRLDSELLKLTQSRNELI